MHLARLWRSTPFRLALAYALLFVTTSLLVYSATFWLLRSEINGWLDNSVSETYSVIYSSYAPGDVEDLVGMVNAFNQLKREDRRVFYVGDGRGTRIAGNLPAFYQTQGLQTVAAENLGLDGEERFRILTGTIDGKQLLVGESLEATDDLAQIILLNFAWMSVATSLLAIAAGAYLAHRAQRRIDVVAEAMDHVSHGKLQVRVPLTGSGDDIDTISAQINSALDRLSTLVESMRQVSTDIAHDLKTPLNRLKVILEEGAIRAERGETTTETLAEALRESDQINRTFQALLRISQIEAGARKSRFAPINVQAVVENVAELFADVAEDNGQKLSLSPSEGHDFILEGDKELLTQLVVNLVENAMTHCPVGAQIELSLSATDTSRTLIVADNGPGIPKDEREKVFRRLYRLDKSRHSPGNGLGLSMVKAIADLHGIETTIEDNNPGTEFRLSWQAPGGAAEKNK